MKYLIIMILLVTSVSAKDNILKTIGSVDLVRYSGTWYEIAKIQNSFQDHCEKNTTAIYEIGEDGDIKVINRCIDFENEMDDAEGVARIVDKKTNSKLEVSFVSLLGWNIFWGDYWILGLDENYRYAVIGTPSRKYGWILSRTPKLSAEDLENCYTIFENNGYSRKNFELSPQE